MERKRNVLVSEANDANARSASYTPKINFLCNKKIFNKTKVL